MKPAYNMKSSAVKRILQEAKELSNEGSNEFEAHPLEDNIFEWHFTISGPVGTDFEGGRYHGRILLPTEYPFKPPHLIFLTPNGRFELHTKVCLSVTDHHPEHWQPSWGIRTVLLAVMGFLPTQSKGALGGLDYPKEERQRLAKKSKTWTCNVCGIKNEEFISNNKTSSSTTTKLKEKEIDLPTFTFSMESSANTPGSEINNKTFSSNPLSENNDRNNDYLTSPSIPIQRNDNDINSNNNLSNSNHKSLYENDLSTTSSYRSPTSSSSTNEKNDININSKDINIQTNQRHQASSSLPTNHIHPPMWLDFLIGALVTLLLYILYRKYM